MNTRQHENAYVKGWVEGGIMYAIFKPEKMDYIAAKECVSLRVQAASGQYFPVLIDARKVNSITKEARDYFASVEGSSFIVASALVLDSVVGKFLGNFFLQINKPKVPLRLFTNEGEALNWLKQYKVVDEDAK